MEKVSWELKKGLCSFQNLVAMLTEAITSLRIPVNKQRHLVIMKSAKATFHS